MHGHRLHSCPHQRECWPCHHTTLLHQMYNKIDHTSSRQKYMYGNNDADCAFWGKPDWDVSKHRAWCVAAARDTNWDREMSHGPSAAVPVPRLCKPSSCNLRHPA